MIPTGLEMSRRPSGVTSRANPTPIASVTSHVRSTASVVAASGRVPLHAACRPEADRPVRPLEARRRDRELALGAVARDAQRHRPALRVLDPRVQLVELLDLARR